ncbi:PhoP regulatory network YrbL family protein [Gammaproteobacteria bacterium]|nr:PhoP regulatory network YrbL family protein [Gammaproteobacteria bacterium]
MINLDGVSTFAKGGNRRCYVSPINPKRCLKVLHENLLDKLKENSAWYKRLGNNAGLDDNLREMDAYNQRAISSPINSSVWNHLAKWYGMVETNLGPASETELILNDGEIAETLETYLFREGLTPEIQKALKTFETWLRTHLVLTKNIIPHNVVIKKENSSLILMIIDGLGCKSFIPLPKYSRFFARIYVERRIKLMWSRIHWDLGGRIGDWK